jgi:hypothetical protein
MEDDGILLNFSTTPSIVKKPTIKRGNDRGCHGQDRQDRDKGLGTRDRGMNTLRLDRTRNTGQN